MTLWCVRFIDPTVVHRGCGSTSAMCWRLARPSLSKRHHSLLSQASEPFQPSPGQGLPSTVSGIEIVGAHSPVENNKEDL